MYIVGNTVDFSCIEGHYLTGDAAAQCTENQTWTPGTRVCKSTSSLYVQYVFLSYRSSRTQISLRCRQLFSSQVPCAGSHNSAGTLWPRPPKRPIRSETQCPSTVLRGRCWTARCQRSCVVPVCSGLRPLKAFVVKQVRLDPSMIFSVVSPSLMESGSSSAPTAPTPPPGLKCKPWENLGTTECVCKMPFQCS